MFRSLPPLAIILGAAGVIPFVLFGFAAVGGAPDPALRATQALVGYGAVIMSFLGAVHWGFMLGEREEEPGGAGAAGAGCAAGAGRLGGSSCVHLPGSGARLGYRDRWVSSPCWWWSIGPTSSG